MSKENVKVPQPLMNYVLVDNPLKGEIVEKYAEELKAIPKDRQPAYLMTKLGKTFEKLKVVAVGPMVRDLKVGDEAIVSMDIVTQGIPVCEDKYWMTKEHNFLGKW